MNTFLLFLTFLFPFTLYAEEWKTSFGAELEAEGMYWSDRTVGLDSTQTRGIYTIKAPSTVRRGRSLRLRALPVLQLDPSNVSKNERVFWDFPEGYVQWQNLPWTVQAGMNVFNWGDTDVFNPLDVVNARRYFDPLRSEKLGAPALVVKRDFTDFFVEAVYIPKQRKTLLPGENSRWLPRDVYRVRSIGTAFGPTKILLPTNLRYKYDTQLEVENALENNYGLRMKFRFPGFDWTIAGFQGAAQAPDVRIRSISVTTNSYDGTLATLTVDPDITLQAAYYPIRMTGTSFTWVLGNVLMKGASAYTHVLNRRFDLPARIWENVLGLESTIGVGGGALTMLVQATKVDSVETLDTNSISLSRMFEEAGMGALRWAPSDRFTVLLSYLRDMKFKGSMWHGEATYKIADGWRAKLASDLLEGPMETPIGTYRRNDRTTLSLLAQF